MKIVSYRGGLLTISNKGRHFPFYNVPGYVYRRISGLIKKEEEDKAWEFYLFMGRRM